MSDRPSASQATSRIPAGTRLNGIYEIDQRVASGGMGEIYRGHAIQTGDPVAIKVIRSDLADDDSILALFRKEASALHYLHHEAIVRYYVFSVDPDLQRPYLAMEFVDGQSLSDLLQQGPLPFDAVLLLLQRMASGLHAAHERGIIHRDVSPDNIIIPKGDIAHAKIIDFGIARSTQIGEGTIIGGGFAGKYNYVSPEQLGLYGGEVTGKSDIYSLGLVLVQALTGRALDMGGNQVEVIDKRRTVPDLSAVDARIRPLIERMLQPHPEDRPESMAVVAAWRPQVELPVRRPEELTARELRRRTKLERKKSAGRTRIATAAVLVLAVVGGAGAAVYYFSSEAPTVNPPQIALPKEPAKGDVASLPPAPPPSANAPSPPPDNSGAANAATKTSATPPPAKPEPPPQASQQQARLNPPDTPKPTPPKESQAPVGRVEQITRFINQYDGGDCFLATPVAVADGKATIEGYGSSVVPFELLNFDFKRANGFEADIGVRQVTQAQCPAIAFLARLRGERGSAPKIDLTATNVRTGVPLAGSVSGYGTRNVELLLVSDDGMVHNLSGMLKASGDSKSFNIRMQRTDDGGGQPQLLLAVSTAQPLDALKSTQPMASDQVFPQVLAEAAQKGQVLNASSRYFKLDK